MADHANCGCTGSDSEVLERVNYFTGHLLTAEDMNIEQTYILQKMRRHNFYLHGSGVVCGLIVSPDATVGAPRWQIHISPGYAIGPCGEEIYVPEPISFDPTEYGPDANPSQQPTATALRRPVSRTLWIAIRYQECKTDPVPVLANAGETDSREYSRIRDSFHVECLAEAPTYSAVGKTRDSRNRTLPACPPCPTHPWVLLAKVGLRRGRKLMAIDNSVRRLVASTAVPK